MPALCQSRKAIRVQALLIASLTACTSAGSCTLPAKPTAASALLQRHHRRGSQPVPEFAQRQLLFGHGMDNDHESNNLSKSAVPSRAFVATSEDWLALDNGTTGALATASDVGIGPAIVGEPANARQDVVWAQGTSVASMTQPVSTGKSEYRPWGSVAGDDTSASANVTAIDVTGLASDGQSAEPASSPVESHVATEAVTPGGDASNSHFPDAIAEAVSFAVGNNTKLASNNASLNHAGIASTPMQNSLVVATKEAVSFAVGNNTMLASNNASLNNARIASTPMQNSLVVATKEVVQKGHKDSKDSDADADKDKDVKGKKAKKDDKAKGDAKGKKDEESKKSAKGDESKKEASNEATNEDSNEDSGPASKPSQANMVMNYIMRMTTLDVVGFGGAGVVMFLFLVLADII